MNYTNNSKTNNIIVIESISSNDKGAVEIGLTIDDTPETILMTFSKNVTKYLTTDRCDAAIMGLLMLAIRTKKNIVSNIPISESLYYKITEDLIPGLCIDEKVYAPDIKVSIISDAQPDNDSHIVATGISCGVDSLYSVMDHINHKCESFNLNSLVFLNAGSHHFGTDDQSQKLYKGRRENAIAFSKEINLELIEISTNLPEIIERHQEKYEHIEHHTFTMLSCILMMQKGVSKYYYSGGYPYAEFDCKLNPDQILGSAHYDLLTLFCASNQNIHFYSSGGSVTRLNKIISLGNYKPSEQYLNVCVADIKNCGHCFKCKRTLLELDAAGTLDKYGAVFDIEDYKNNRKSRILEGYRSLLRGEDSSLNELKSFFEKELTPTQRHIQRLRVSLGKLYSYIRK